MMVPYSHDGSSLLPFKHELNGDMINGCEYNAAILLPNTCVLSHPYCWDGTQVHLLWVVHW